MKKQLSLVLALLLFFLPGQVTAGPSEARSSAEGDVVKSYCAAAYGYAGPDELKADLLLNAKRLAVNELFGELIVASTAVENFVVTSDQIRASSIGFVRIRGSARYYNGENLAEVCVSITAYVMKEDRSSFTPFPFSKRQCVTDADLTTRELSEFAREEVLVQALLNYDPALEIAPRDDLLRLVQRVNYLDSGFVPETETYCVSATGYLVPIEITAYLSLDDESPNDGTAETNGGIMVVRTNSGEIVVHPVDVTEGTAVIHYYRPDGIYDGWGLHVWEDTTDKVSWATPLLPTDKTDSSVYFVINLKSNAKRLGLIVHKGDEKDPGPDMFFEVTKDRQAWIVSGDSTVFKASSPVPK